MIMFWIVAGALTLALLGLVLRPLLRPVATEGILPEEVYKAQLGEIDRELEVGLVSPEDADAARAEIGRRLLRLSEGEESSEPMDEKTRNIWIGAIVFVLIIVSGALYFYLGSPNEPAQPFASRDLAAESADQLGPAAEELERQLAQIEDPADRAVFLGDAFASLGGLDEAMQSYLNANRLRPNDPDILTRLGEVVVVRSQGRISPEALIWIDRALESDPDHPAANFYRAQADFQAGSYAAAEERLTALRTRAPEGAPWIENLDALLAQIRDAQGRAAIAEDMNPAEREAMIRQMVEGLDARLQENPDDFEGWLQLARARAVLQEPDAAQAALDRARAMAEGEAILMQRVEEAARSLGLE